MCRIVSVVAIFLIGTKLPVEAHINMLLPDLASVKKGETVTFTYQWGHPFEHQLFDAPKPDSLIVLEPSGKKADLLATLKKTSVSGSDGKAVTAYFFQFTPSERGDYIFLLDTPSIWMEEEKQYFRDTVKVVLHVQTQNGWNRHTNGVLSFEFIPLTRPYGLRAGMVFQAKAPELERLVEIERYNPTPPKELPADEHITRTSRTDPNGVVTTTLPEAGWWSLTTGNLAERGDKDRPTRQRTTLWVYVDGKVSAK